MVPSSKFLLMGGDQGKSPFFLGPGGGGGGGGGGGI